MTQICSTWRVCRSATRNLKPALLSLRASTGANADRLIAFAPCAGCKGDKPGGELCNVCTHQTLVAMTNISVDMILRGEY